MNFGTFTLIGSVTHNYLSGPDFPRVAVPVRDGSGTVLPLPTGSTPSNGHYVPSVRSRCPEKAYAYRKEAVTYGLSPTRGWDTLYKSPTRVKMRLRATARRDALSSIELAVFGVTYDRWYGPCREGQT